MAKSILAPVLAVCLLASPSLARAENCTEESLLGAWVTTWDTTETWTFAEDGKLLCEGFCEYGLGLGRPQAWENEPHANLWASSLEHIRLIFTEYRFEGTTGSFRCKIEADGKELVLDPMCGRPLRLTR